MALLTLVQTGTPLAGFSNEDIGSYAPSVREEKGKPHHDFGNRRSDSSPTVTS